MEYLLEVASTFACKYHETSNVESKPFVLSAEGWVELGDSAIIILQFYSLSQETFPRASVPLRLLVLFKSDQGSIALDATPEKRESTTELTGQMAS